MKKQLLAVLMMSLLAGGVAAKTVASVNGQNIDSALIDQQVTALKEQSGGRLKENQALRDEITRRLILHTVLLQEAKKEKVDTSKEFKDYVASVREELKKQGRDKDANFNSDWAEFLDEVRVQMYLKTLSDKLPASDAEIKKAYDDLKTLYTGTSEVRLGRIITRDKKKATEALAALKAKKPFDDVAKQFSEAGAPYTSAKFIALKDLEQANPELYKAIKDLKAGEFTDVIHEDGVYGLFSVVKKQLMQVPELSVVSADLAAGIEAAHVDNAVNELVQKANVKTDFK